MKISIVIPTLNRCGYLKECLRSVLAIDDPELEVVVSDNCSEDQTAQYLAGVSDPRLKVLRTPRRLAMRANFDFALEAATGDYISFIGDDDGYLPGQFGDLRQILTMLEPDCLFWALPIYTWPDDGPDHFVKLRRRNVFGTPTEIDNAHYLKALLKGEIEQTNWAPAIYHGMASRRYIDRTRLSDGTYFAANSPDIYFGYRSILAGGRIFRVEHPFSLGGQSIASNGKAHSAGKQSKVASSFIADNKADPYCDVLPQLLSVPWALFSTLETVRARTEYDQMPDYGGWYRYLLGEERKAHGTVRPEVQEAMQAQARSVGATDALDAALASAATQQSGWLDKLRRELSNTQRIKISPPAGGENTVFTAAQEIDRIIGPDFSALRAGQTTASRAWSAAKRRVSTG